MSARERPEAECDASPSDAPTPRDVGVVIVAAGGGTRAGGDELKQFRWVAGKAMLLHSVQTFMARPDVVAVVCVLPQQYAGDPPPWLFQCDVDRLYLSLGGRARTESGHPLDHGGHEVKAVEVIENDHVERRGRGAFFLVAAHMQVVVIGAPVGQAVD